jgi:gluconokinase
MTSPLPAAIIVMGVSGAGKTTLGQALAARLRHRFIEGDALHPPANVAKMSAGSPLDDEDRWPWLRACAAELAEAARQGGGVLACSALKRRYRDLLRERVGAPVLFVLPELPVADLRRRLGERRGHYMPPGLLDSQLAALEPPDADEPVVSSDATRPVAAQLAALLGRLG